MKHEGLAALERVLDALPKEHRGPLEQWMIDYVQLCELYWKVDPNSLPAGEARAKKISELNAAALFEIGKDVASKASVVSVIEMDDGTKVATFRASVAVVSPKAPPPRVEVIRP